MTNEEAIGKLSNIKFYLTAGNPIWDADTIRDAMDMAIEAIKQNQWIPCEERLPEERKEVLVTVWGRCEVAFYNCASDGLQEWAFNDFSLDDEDFTDVTAWMPLPKPYEGRTDAIR